MAVQLDLAELYELIEDVSRELKHEQNASQPTDPITQSDMPALWRAMLELFGGSTAYGSDLPKILGIKEATINRFVKGGAGVSRKDALKLADRTVSYLRSIESQVARDPPPDEDEELILVPDKRNPPLPPPTPPPATFQGSLWKVVPNDPNTKAKIAEVSGLLEQLVRMAKGSNASGDHAALTDIERASLIAVLETALAVLKSPHVEKGLLQKLKDMLGKTAKQAAEKETEEAFGVAADAAKNVLGDVIKGLFS